jgi:hypothetical protein
MAIAVLIFSEGFELDINNNSLKTMLVKGNIQMLRSDKRFRAFKKQD